MCVSLVERNRKTDERGGVGERREREKREGLERNGREGGDGEEAHVQFTIDYSHLRPRKFNYNE